MDQFLNRYNLPRLVQEEIVILNRPVSIKETESILITFLNKNHQFDIKLDAT